MSKKARRNPNELEPLIMLGAAIIGLMIFSKVKDTVDTVSDTAGNIGDTAGNVGSTIGDFFGNIGNTISGGSQGSTVTSGEVAINNQTTFDPRKILRGNILNLTIGINHMGPAKNYWVGAAIYKRGNRNTILQQMQDVIAVRDDKSWGGYEKVVSGVFSPNTTGDHNTLVYDVRFFVKDFGTGQILNDLWSNVRLQRWA